MSRLVQAPKWFVMAAMLVWPVMAQANIGDDLGQLRGRYGAAKEIGGQMLFQIHLVDDKIARLPPSSDQHEGYSVAVYFDGEHSAMEVFTRNSGDPAKLDIPQADIDDILTSEGEGKAWNPAQVHSGKPTWVRSDGKIIARFSANAGGKADGASVLVIMLNSK